jgi:uncharacterized iron-regulated membrane protein
VKIWQTWMQRPRTVFLRKACFQIHLWLGLALAVYVAILSLTGSAIVFRRELDVAFGPDRPEIDKTQQVLPPEQLGQFAQRGYPDHTIEDIGGVQRRWPVVQITMRRDDEVIERVFNAYTGEDLGDPFPWKSEALLWLVTLHDDLLMPTEQRGRFWNGVGSILTTILCLTGAIVWWPGVRNWRRGMAVKWDAHWPRFNFDLHSAVGFWFFLMILLWAVTGIYLSFPTPFMNAVNIFFGPDSPDMPLSRPIDVVIEWMVRLHFGRWRSHTLKVVWVIIGLVPMLMLVTGAVMWWNRVVVRSRRASAVAAGQPVLRLQQESQGVE